MSIKGKLVGLVLLMSLVLGALAGYMIWASYRIRHQVSYFLPAIGYLRGIADTRINITRQVKEGTDYLLLADPVDRDHFRAFGQLTREAVELWLASARTQKELGVPGESEDLEEAERVLTAYDEWEKLLQRLFSLAAAGQRQEALGVFAERSDLLIEGVVLAGIDRAFEDGITEVQNAYHDLLLTMGLIPWLAEDGAQRIRATQASIEYLIAVNRVSAGVNRQVKALLDYLLTGSEHDLQYFTDYGKDTKHAIEDCARAANHKATLDPTSKQELLQGVVNLERGYGQILALARAAIELKQGGRQNEALRLVVERLDPLLDVGLMPRISLALDDGGQEILALTAAASRRGVAVVVLVSLLIVAGSYRLIHEMLSSLRKLRTGIEVIGRGNLDYRINLESHDELGALASSFDAMADRLQKSRADIDRLNVDLERRVEERTDQLRTANRELESFSYSVSHDLRAPLARIDGLCQLLLVEDEASLPDGIRATIDKISRSATEMEQLIGALLSLSRVTSTPLQRGRVDLSEIAQTLAEELRQRDPGREVEFRIAPGVKVHGDRSLLLGAMANLLGNAWKFTARTPRPKIEFGVLNRHGRRTCFVRDNGPGFPGEEAEKVFMPFQRLHETGEFDGTGIGLATVQRIIHRHGGKIWAEAEVNRGATFYFTLGDAPSAPSSTEV